LAFPIARLRSAAIAASFLFLNKQYYELTVKDKSQENLRYKILNDYGSKIILKHSSQKKYGNIKS
jgi:hypothetical protein